MPQKKCNRRRSGKTDVKKGQSLCPECSKVFNNASKPEICECGEYIGGKKNPIKLDNKAWYISENVHSVRENVKGVETRVFVDMAKKICDSEKCAPARTSFVQGGNDPSKFYCPHIELCKSSNQAQRTEVRIDENIKKLLPKKAIDQLTTVGQDDKIDVYFLSPNFVVVPSFSEKTHEVSTKYSHVRNGKCPLQQCKDKKRRHTLGKHPDPVCIHQMAAWIAERTRNKGSTADKTERKKPNSTIDMTWSVTNVLDDVLKFFPKLHDEENIRSFLALESQTLKTLENKTSLDEYVKKTCEGCNNECEKWKPNKAQKGEGLLITVGGMKRIEIPAYYCSRCQLINYPNMAEFGFFVLHTKMCISFNVLIDLRNQMEVGAALIESIKMKLDLLAQASSIDIESELHDLAVKIEKASITFLSSLITGESLDEVICYLCGSFPKIVLTDGNSNDSSPIDQKSMVFTATDEPVEDLATFLRKLQAHVLCTVFYQNVPTLVINMLTLPPTIAPKLLGQALNRERMKKSQFDNDDLASDVDLHKLCELITEGNLNICNLGEHSLVELKSFAKDCMIPSKGTASFLQSKITAAYQRLLSGQGNCHNYTHAQKRTGGQHDAWCEHYFKVASKVQSRQESVVDPVDLIHSLKCVPVLHICDDACTVVSHMLLTFPEKAKLLYGEERGCFQVPKKDVKASRESTPQTTDILPLKYSETQPDITAMEEGCLRHPDTGHCRRYVMGHRLQLKSHKKNFCSYHVLDLCESGRMVKSLGQEGLQVLRKYKRVQQDRNRNFLVAFLFNYVLDFLHNRKKHKEQLKLLKSTKFQGEFKGRDALSWRAKV